MRALRLPGNLVRSMFKRREGAVPYTVPKDSNPRHTDVPALRGAEVAAVYYNLRVAGGLLRISAGGRRRAYCSDCSTWRAPGDTREIPHCHAEPVPNPGTATFCRGGPQ